MVAIKNKKSDVQDFNYTVRPRYKDIQMSDIMHLSDAFHRALTDGVYNVFSLYLFISIKYNNNVKIQQSNFGDIAVFSTITSV